MKITFEDEDRKVEWVLEDVSVIAKLKAIEDFHNMDAEIEILTICGNQLRTHLLGPLKNGEVTGDPLRVIVALLASPSEYKTLSVNDVMARWIDE